MTHHRARKEPKMDINPYVSQLAGRLIQTASDAQIKFDSNGWQLVSEVLSYAAAAEQRMSVQAERIAYLEQLSSTDDLTGIPNRRGLKTRLGDVMAAAARHNDEGVLGFIDLDGFKGINDRHGHLAGDAVLRHVAQMLVKLTRTTDVVARLAGDEFAIVLTRCDAVEGEKRIRTVQQMINASTVSFAGIAIPVHCSIGVMSFNGATDPARLIDHADQAMYRDKLVRKQAFEAAAE
ncbi:GGDEF domain-containing protein [Gimibacter soli]|uniref:diguanylate cyclase n=1 Tax=Gimibacter soli TaxID=3024400 RepID=A0AAF0BN83_9PROT|nr:GGDEF domain-containing protein [Gimibacter soli]WCL55695.1 GGDEF domain-containing protein [Gimibacter soli]